MSNGNVSYSAIPSTEDVAREDDRHKSDNDNWGSVGIVVGGVAILVIFLARNVFWGGETTGKTVPVESSSSITSIPLPYGVNLASWLSLEDYFFVGTNGAVEVATPDGSVAGRCLPPLHTGSSNGPVWNSETDLFGNLAELESVEHAIRAFHAFRVAYMDLDTELSQIANLGVKSVRVPMTWCHTDHDPTHDKILARGSNGPADDAELLERYACKDPFFAKEGTDVWWPALPRTFLAHFLTVCGRYGIKATLDVHTYPGGTSPGTFSGVWPRQPLFWQFDTPESPDADFGRSVYQDLLAWLEGLSDMDPDAFLGLGGITPMNEPAHLAGLYGPGSPNPSVTSFLPSLPKDMTKDFLHELNDSTASPGATSISVPDGPHLRVLLWQRDAVAAFRTTSLPRLGIQLLVNIHESIFVPSLVPDDQEDDGGRHPHATSIIAAWWRGTTSPEERRTWAVMDMHHYHAWEPTCQGTVDGAPYGRYTCGDHETTENVLSQCSSWADVYRDAFDEQLDEDSALLASGEFSASTHHSVLHSCRDVTTLRASYLAQVNAGNQARVKLFWWSWKMPYGDAFRPAWSFKHLLYLLEVEGFDYPDAETVGCGT